MAQPLKLTTSQQNFQGGVDSSKVTLIASERNPNGLGADQLAWAFNCTVRRGGISPRPGWTRIGTVPQGQFMDAEIYAPLNAYPYIISMIAGQIYQHRVDTDNSIVNLSEQSGLTMPVTTKGFMCQGEEFLVIQAGDYETLPLFWDGMNLVRSRGFTADSLPNPTFTVPAIGGVVLATLTAPYTGGTNELFTIDGYQYRQVAPAQRYNVSSVVNGATPAYISGQIARIIYSEGLYIPASAGGNPAVTVAAFTANYSTLGAPPIPDSGTPTAYLQSTTIIAATQYELLNHPTTQNLSGGPLYTWSTITFNFTPNPLAAPGANEVWLINVNDPRAGTVVTPTMLPPQLPAGGPMDYYMGRMWVANGTEYLGGDIVGGSSGTGIYGYRDAILSITENEYLSGGGTFAVPTNSGNITALKHNANLDTALGQGLLFPFTRKSIYSVNVPPDRAEWDVLEEPLQRVAQINFGTTSDRSVIPVNGDLFYRSPDGIRSLIMAIRYFGQWGNTPISEEVIRALQNDDQTLLDWVSAVNFENRLLTTCLPVETDFGVAYRGLVSLDFDLVSSMRGKTDPAWEGIWEGLDILKLVKGDFGGVERTFAFVRARLDNTLGLWELSKDNPEDENSFGPARITWIFETPSYDWGNCNQLKELDTLRIWIDRVYGKVDFTLYYRNDQNACWNYWNAWSTCAARNDCEDPGNEYCEYPTTIYKQQYRAMMTMPKAPQYCDVSMDRPTNQGYSFQFRLVIKGSCRVRGLFAYAMTKEEQAYPNIVCPPTDPCAGCPEGSQGAQGADGARGAGMVTYFGVGDPNGVQEGNQGDAYKDSVSGELWHKSTPGTGTDGWI
jgi:hypothetical protein